jgi:cytochrome c-type biogenesis protein
MGGMLILFALLIATDTVNLIADAMLRWFPNWSSLG